jgi:hypothetical protein
MASPDGPPPPVSNPITGTWRNSFADKDQKDRVLSLRTMNVQKVIYSEKGNVYLLCHVIFLKLARP